MNRLVTTPRDGGRGTPLRRKRLGLADLPEDVLLCIFSHIPTPFQLTLVGETCRRLNEVSRSAYLWKKFCGDPVLTASEAIFSSYCNIRKIRGDIMIPRHDMKEQKEERCGAVLRRVVSFLHNNILGCWDHDAGPFKVTASAARLADVTNFSRKRGGMGAILDIMTKARRGSDRDLKLTDITTWHRMMCDDLVEGSPEGSVERSFAPGCIRSAAFDVEMDVLSLDDDHASQEDVGLRPGGVYPPLPASQVPDAVRSLVEKINKAHWSGPLIGIYVLLGDVYFRLLRDRPFKNGNAMVARILANYIILRYANDGRVPLARFDRPTQKALYYSLKRDEHEEYAQGVFALHLLHTITDREGNYYDLDHVRTGSWTCVYMDRARSVEIVKEQKEMIKFIHRRLPAPDGNMEPLDGIPAVPSLFDISGDMTLNDTD